MKRASGSKNIGGIFEDSFGDRLQPGAPYGRVASKLAKRAATLPATAFMARMQALVIIPSRRPYSIRSCPASSNTKRITIDLMFSSHRDLAAGMVPGKCNGAGSNRNAQAVQLSTVGTEY